MFYLVLAILGSIGIPLIIRLSKGKIASNYGMFFTNYLLCLIISLIVSREFTPFSYGNSMIPVFIIGAVTGCCYLASLTYYDLNIKKVGLVITSIFKKVSIIIPILVSVLIFKNELTINHLIGIILALLAIIIMNYQKGSFSKIKHLDILIINTILTGFCELGKDLFAEICDANLINYYTVYLFGFAMIATLIVMIITKNGVGKNEIIFGFAIGVPNYLNARFLTMALSAISSIIVFPIYYMLTMVGTSLVGIIFFKEKINLKIIVATIIVIVATIILNI